MQEEVILDNIYKSEIKRAFLTFDDGPSSKYIRYIRYIKTRKCTSNFFCFWVNVDEYFTNSKEKVYKEGHYIANHGYSRIYFFKYYQSPQSVLDEYNQCEDSVKKAIGENEYNSHLFRFAGGLVGGKYAEIKRQANQLLNENDILHINWNA